MAEDWAAVPYEDMGEDGMPSIRADWRLLDAAPFAPGAPHQPRPRAASESPPSGHPEALPEAPGQEVPNTPDAAAAEHSQAIHHQTGSHAPLGTEYPAAHPAPIPA